MDLSLTIIIILLISLCFFAKRTKTSTTNLPPGPPGLPILGNLLDLGDKPHQSLANFAKSYGPLMSLKLGRVTTVVVSSAALAKEILQTHDLTFANRTVVDAVKALDHHDDSLGWLPIGTKWRILRKVCNSYIFTTQKLDQNQQLRRNKIQDLIDKISESCKDGTVMVIREAAFVTTLNALSNTVFSLDLTDMNSERVREFKDSTRSIVEESGIPNASDYFPLLRKIDLQGIRRSMSLHFGKVLSLMDRIIEERVRARKSENYVASNDMLDTLLSFSEGNNQEMDVYRMKHLFLDLFVAGTDTTSSTLEWAMTELLRNPKALTKAKVELAEVIGKGKIVEESDITRLSYLQAVIKETLRLHPAVPLLLPRKAGANVQLCGYTVPKDAQVMVNAWAIGRDPSLWEDPLSFVPERFLTCNIDAQGHNFELIPFGAGRRICPGLPLAMRMLHLMLASLINAFDWKLEDGTSPESLNMEEKFGFALQKAQPLKAIPMQV